MEKELTVTEVLAKHVKMEPQTLWGERTIYSKDALKAMIYFSDQNTKPLTISLQDANNQNYNLLQEKLKLENDILDIKKTIATYSTSSKDMSDITKTCEKQRNYSLCDIWENTVKGCASCKFYRSKNKEK